jgi:hypothetical protein
MTLHTHNRKSLAEHLQFDRQPIAIAIIVFEAMKVMQHAAVNAQA